jgi:hypothetical protein
VLFDLLNECDAARRNAAEGTLGFRINHVMVGPINKTLDLVVTVVPSMHAVGQRATFASMVQRYGIRLSPSERAALDALPAVYEDLRSDVHEVAVALEAKACMTEHSKSLPRLHAEILATGYLARMAAPNCITVSYSIVNVAESFKSPGRTSGATIHDQPGDATKVVNMIRRAIPLARGSNDLGYNAVGVTVLDCKNDGSPVRVSDGSAAPKANDPLHYERMIRALCSAYRARFRY